MRSQISFVMHPEDEVEFVSLALTEPNTVFVNGPKWTTPTPALSTDIASVGNYLMIWNPSETRPLSARHHEKDGKEWWYCDNEFLTIQFIRSGIEGERFLFTGRLAVATTEKWSEAVYDKESAASVERRFKSLSRAIKKMYSNGVILWQDVSRPRSRTNPSKPDPACWIGPHALRWLNGDPKDRYVQQFRNVGAHAYLIDLVGSTVTDGNAAD